MPEMDGMELLKEVRDQYPETVRIMMTAHKDFDVAMRAINDGRVYRFIHKPWNDEEMKKTVREALNHYESKKEEQRLFELAKEKNDELDSLAGGLKEEVDAHLAELNEANQQLESEIRSRKEAEEARSAVLRDLEKTLKGTVQAMLTALGAKDPYTADHQRRVAELARMIAEDLGLPREEIEGIYMASLIHDLGKIAIPTEILNKPFSLSEAEFGIIKRHPDIACDILEGIDFPWPVADMVRQHHERLNGSGYPMGLSGDEILYGAKIMAVADTVEAMASDRPYRPGKGTDEARKEISDNKGMLYDTVVVEACTAVLDSGRFSLTP
jgi:response regulator RpfG family c-di-GMP phosphodiesterase